MRTVTEPTNDAPMLAGLIFAIEEASDRAGTLVATLPFGGMTLLEYQIRLLHGAGAEQVLVAVGRMTPQLLAAVNRITKGDLAVEIVRSAEDAADKVAPDARVLVMADGLVTADPVMDKMAKVGREALLVTDDAGSPAAIERLDMKDCWAGIAVISPEQLGQIAQMPEDYDFQSALLRVAAQSGADHVQLAATWLRGGHAVERSAEGLVMQNASVLAALTERSSGWADRLFARGARIVLPELVNRNVPAWTLGAGGGVLGLGGLAGCWFGWSGSALVAALLSTFAFASGAAMFALRGEEANAKRLELAIFALFVVMALATGATTFRSGGGALPIVLALIAVGTQSLVERVPVGRRRWWSSPAAQLLLLTPFGVAGQLVYGLGAVTLYGFATLSAAIEATREKP